VRHQEEVGSGRCEPSCCKVQYKLQNTARLMAVHVVVDCWPSASRWHDVGCAWTHRYRVQQDRQDTGASSTAITGVKG
jgi:hypothetical protein